MSVDGFFAGPLGEIDWFKATQPDAEFDAFTHQQTQSNGALIFGHTTYEMMKSYWPTQEAMKDDPHMAEVVNKSPKIVFSKALQSVEEGPHWKNITLVHEVKRTAIAELKEQKGKDMTILGSGTIVQQLARMGLIDDYSLVIVPAILGVGKYLFQDVTSANLNLVEARAFKNGLVYLHYQPNPS